MDNNVVKHDGKMFLTLSEEENEMVIKAAMDYSRKHNLIVSRQKMIVNMIKYYAENFKNQ